MTEYDFWYSVGFFHEQSDYPCEYCVVEEYKCADLCNLGCGEAIKNVYKRVMEEEAIKECQNGNH